MTSARPIERFEELDPEWSRSPARESSWLFDRDAWIRAWWRHFAASGELLACPWRERSGDARGAVLLHRYKARLRGLVPITRLEFVGNTRHSHEASPSEFAGIPGIPTGADVDLGEIWRRVLATPGWDDFAFTNAHLDSVAANSLRATARGLGYRVHDEDIGSSYMIEGTQSWDRYLSDLSYNTRRRLYNDRQRHLDRFEIRYAARDALAAVLQRQRELISRRFSSPPAAISGFFADLAAHALDNESLLLSELFMDGQLLSSMYCIECNENVFFLRLGIEECPPANVSPGMLHLGFVIERTLQRGQSLWLLSGKGLKQDYKSRLGRQVPVGTVRVMRPGLVSLFVSLIRKPSGNHDVESTFKE